MTSAMWIVAGVSTLAAAVGLLVGLVAEWGLIGGAVASGRSFDLWLVIEVALVAAVAVLLIAAIRQPRQP
jgi:hypothetical protein